MGFRVKSDGLRVDVGGTTLREVVHTSIDAMLDHLLEVGGQGTSAQFNYPADAVNPYTIYLVVAEVSGKQSCEHCAGTGFRDSVEVVDDLPDEEITVSDD